MATMKTSEVFNLSLEEFEKKLSPINHEYVVEVYKSTVRAWGFYREGAELTDDPDYPEVNEYFNISRKNNVEYAQYLKELFE
jgi:hypothetical protein